MYNDLPDETVFMVVDGSQFLSNNTDTFPSWIVSNKSP